MKVPYQCLKALVWLFCCICLRHVQDVSAQNSPLFDVRFTRAGIVSLTKPIDDAHPLQCIASDKILGHVGIRYRLDAGPWQSVHTSDVQAEQCRVIRSTSDEHLVSYDFGTGKGLVLSEHFVCERDTLQWRLRLINQSEESLEIGDLALPLPMNTTYPKHRPEETFTSRLFRHSFISGHGSFVFWLPVGGKGPHLAMTPLAGTRLEYFSEARANYAVGGSGYTAYIHSAALAGEARGGSWRQEPTSLRLSPGEDVTYGFQFHWTDSYQGVRDILYETGGFDVRVAPGMVVPEDLSTRVALRTRNTIRSLTPEFPHETQIDTLGQRQMNTHLYRLRFSRLGENRVTVHTDDGKAMVLEFFVTQPLETLIKKRAAFITHKQQHRDPNTWYNGLFSLWDMRKGAGQNLLGPDNLGGQHLYAVSGSDDPSSGKPVFLAEKNVAYPDARQIAALEYYLEHFVWGKHQRTDQESPYPYGIYGSDHWLMNRQATRDPIDAGKSRPGKGGSGCRMWRTFDYTHYIQLYTNMYRIAKQHPQLVHYLDAQGYLERAWGTARAYFEVPYGIHMEGGWAFTGWTDWAYKLGNFHEKYLLPLMEALEAEGQTHRAGLLRAEWEKKVKYFLYDDPYPYTSEMPVDSTAFESSYAIAKYALTHELKPDHRLWQDKNSGQWYSHPKIDPEVHQAFMQRQLLVNLACRGWLETSYYHLGSDFRGLGSSGYTLSYMSQMGGWAVLDHALHFAENPADTLRLGYASLLSSWALVNSGTAASDYGFWFPGKQHDGAVGWGFCPQRVGQEWNRGCWDPNLGGVPRGIWPVCGEIDHGLCAGVEAACTVVLDDPVFGLMAYGGSLETDGNLISVVCRDGVRQRLHFLQGDTRFHLRLDRDGFARDLPVIFDERLTRLEFSLESRSQAAHTARVTLQGLPKGTYTITVDGKISGTPITASGQTSVVALSVPAESQGIRVRIARDVPEQASELDVHQRQPNVILILADDLGWAELGCYGNTFNETPNLDRLAQQGMRFTDAYAPAPVCSPTRASLLTGQHPARVGILDYLRPDTDDGLSPDHVTMAEMLQQAGYATGMIGKWHLSGYAYHGSKNEIRAKDHGFDEELVSEIKGVGNGANFYPYVFRDQDVCWLNVTEKRLPGNEYLVDRMNLEAVDFIARHRHEPFFLYLSHFAPHTILNGKPKLVRKYLKKHPPGESTRKNCYLCQDIGCDHDAGHHWAPDHNPHLAAMLESIDQGVGLIMEQLDKHGLADDTLLIFTSDNGGETNVTSNGPLRQGKSCLYEGGIRVPMICRWPGVVAPDTVCDRAVSIMDFYPTLLQGLNIAPHPGQHLDGLSFLPVLQDAHATLEREVLAWHYPLDKPHFLGGRSADALRSGHWKLIEFLDDGVVELYNLQEDIGETNDLVQKHPQKSRELLRLLQDWRKSVGIE
jgi:arylsulfatase A-like enzyme